MAYVPQSPEQVQQHLQNLEDFEAPMCFSAMIDELLLVACLEKKTELTVNFDLIYHKIFVEGPARTMLTSSQLFSLYKEGIAKSFRTVRWSVMVTDNAWVFTIVAEKIKLMPRFSVVSNLSSIH